MLTSIFYVRKTEFFKEKNQVNPIMGLQSLQIGHDSTRIERIERIFVGRERLVPVRSTSNNP